MSLRGEAFAQNIHPKTWESDFRTPKYLLSWIGDTWGSITHDGACAADNATAKMFDLFGGENLMSGDVLFVSLLLGDTHTLDVVLVLVSHSIIYGLLKHRQRIIIYRNVNHCMIPLTPSRLPTQL